MRRTLCLKPSNVRSQFVSLSPEHQVPVVRLDFGDHEMTFVLLIHFQMYDLVEEGNRGFVSVGQRIQTVSLRPQLFRWKSYSL